MLRRCAEAAAGPGFGQPFEIFLATLFHDAVYEPLAKDNEARSAVLAHEAIAAEPRLASIDVAAVTSLIEATAHHASFKPRDEDDDRSLFLDADMSVLGAPTDVYDAYTRGVRAEYAAVPDEAFRAGRGTFLRGVLAAPAIFLSPFFRGRLEAAARANVARELAAL